MISVEVLRRAYAVWPLRPGWVGEQFVEDVHYGEREAYLRGWADALRYTTDQDRDDKEDR